MESSRRVSESFDCLVPFTITALDFFYYLCHLRTHTHQDYNQYSMYVTIRIMLDEAIYTAQYLVITNSMLS